MVSFVCDICGDSVKKNRVDKHCSTKCRNAWVFTCLECGNAFEGYDYDTHNSCITEVEKYQGHFIKKQKEMKRKQKEEAKLQASKEVNEQSNQEKQEENGSSQENAKKPAKNGTKASSECKNEDNSSSANDTANTDICNEVWIKTNVLKNESEFRGWKKTIKRVMKLASGDSVKKKKLKKCLRNAFQLSSEYSNQSRKEINKIIKEKLGECKRIRVHDDLVVHTKSE